MTDQTGIPEPSSTSDDFVVDVSNDLDQVRELILGSHPNIVPELVQGDSIAELVASIEPARAAYTRIIDSVPTPVTIPAGGNSPVTLDIDQLPTSEKLRRGLAAINRKA